MWHYNGEDEASRCGRKGPDTPAALAKILAKLFKGDKKEFLRIKFRDGYSMYNPPSWVRPDPSVFYFFHLQIAFDKLLACFLMTALAKGHQGIL